MAWAWLWPGAQKGFQRRSRDGAANDASRRGHAARSTERERLDWSEQATRWNRRQGAGRRENFHTLALHQVGNTAGLTKDPSTWS